MLKAHQRPWLKKYTNKKITGIIVLKSALLTKLSCAIVDTSAYFANKSFGADKSLRICEARADTVFAFGRSNAHGR